MKAVLDSSAAQIPAYLMHHVRMSRHDSLLHFIADAFGRLFEHLRFGSRRARLLFHL